MTQSFEVSILVSPDEIMKKEQQKRKLCDKNKERNTFFSDFGIPSLETQQMV